MEFLDKDNIAGQSLLQLVARGSSIITELLRLSDHIPPVFLNSADNANDVKKYAGILFDFRYLKATEAYDESIDKDPEAVDLDEEFRDNHLQLLERFYTLFDSIYKYIDNLNSYVEDMNNGSFLQYTVDGVLDDPQGKQLLCEAYYLYGCMLLLMDLRIPGIAREKMIIAYYRYKGSALLHNIDEVCRICRDTGFTLQGKRPPNYPQEYFARVPVDADVIDMVIGRLRSDDVYNHFSAFPLPIHRPTALASQAALLYVILYFSVDILKDNVPVCREIIDKFFSDNWVVSMYMGFTIDLNDAWEPYKAAKTALKGTYTRELQEKTIQYHANQCSVLNQALDRYLTHGVLTDEYIMDSQRKILIDIRACNVTLRWLLLHRTSSNPKLRQQVENAVSISDLLKLIMNSGQLEFIFKTACQNMVDEKQIRWDKVRREASEIMKEISEVYGGTKALSRVKKNDKLKVWFEDMANEISNVNLHNSIVAGRTLTQLVQAIQTVESNHHVEASLQVVQTLHEVRQMLSDMVRLANITNKLLGDLDIICDFSYAQKLIVYYTPYLHQILAKDPSKCLLLRSTFLKLSSVLSTPLVRILQSGSSDDISVAQYFSTNLVTYVRNVLDVIPNSVFLILDKLSILRGTKLRTLPVKMERKDLKDASQLEQRYILSKLTHNISIFTKGILNMSTTLLGVINLDPHHTLEMGIRKQLVRVISDHFHEHLIFTSNKLTDFESKLKQLGHKLNALKQSLEYIQDYINTYGLKIWQEEISRIINYNVEQECNEFLKKKVYDWQSQYQNDDAPIPNYPRIKAQDQGNFNNFTGRLLNEIMKFTAPQTHTYSPLQQSWYAHNSNTMTVGPNVFALLRTSLTVFGLSGLDKLLSFKIVKRLTDVIRFYKSIYTTPSNTSSNLNEVMLSAQHQLTPASQFPKNGIKIYSTLTNALEKKLATLAQLVTSVGQMILLRFHLCRELHFSAQMEANALYSTINTMNTSIMNALTAHYSNSEKYNYPDNPIMPELTAWLDRMGMVDPISKIYITTDPIPHPSLTLFILVLYVCSKLKWDPVLHTLVSMDKSTYIDGASFIVGMVCIFHQIHNVHSHTWLTWIGQYVRATVSTSQSGNSQATAIPKLTNTVLIFANEYCRYANMPREAIEAVIPSYLLDATY